MYREKKVGGFFMRVCNIYNEELFRDVYSSSSSRRDLFGEANSYECKCRNIKAGMKGKRITGNAWVDGGKVCDWKK